MDILLFIFLVSAFSGAVFLILGYLVAVKQHTNLINGVDFSRLADVEKFAQFLGHSISLIGILMAGVGLLLYLQIVGLVFYLIAVVILSIFPLPALFFAKRKYSK